MPIANATKVPTSVLVKRLIATALWGGGVMFDGACAAPVPFSGSIDVDLAAAGTTVPAALLGNNVQWVDNGDGLISSTGDPRMAALNGAAALRPTVLRYPGGSLSDTYHWRDGVGPIGSRGNDRTLDNGYQPVHFGTDEFLKLTAYLSAIPLITVNVVTGDAKEAADWVAYVNGSGAAYRQRVKYWEIGNEPYLIENARPDLQLAPAEFARRANAAILAMKAADPAIMVGLPLRSDTIGGIAATPFTGYNKTVLGTVSAPIDFVSVHNAYLPFHFTSTTVTDQDLYSSAMAASAVMAADLDATAAQLHALRPNQFLPMALTEYNALFGLGSAQYINYTNSLGGALYVADVLRVLCYRNDIVAANLWSLLGNGSFGALDGAGLARPAYYVMQAYSTLLKGKLLPAAATSMMMDTAKVGAVPASRIAVIGAAVTLENKTLRLLVLNKHGTTASNVTLRLANGTALAGARFSQLSGADLFAGASGHGAISVASGTLATGGTAMVLALPAHSMSMLEIDLK
jgi:alpha-L-arabinofuranosidase